jgi:inosine-uridine nucleoside N-ribohydrolase
MMTENATPGPEGIHVQELPRIIMFTDPGRDQDDTMAFIAARRLQMVFEIGFLTTVTTLSPTARRAQLAQYLVDYLRLTDTMVARGFDSPKESATPPFPYEFRGIPENYGEKRIHPDPSVLLDSQLKDAPDKSVDALVIAGFTDLDRYLSDPERKKQFLRCVKKITVMGGLKNIFYKLSPEGYLRTDSSSNYGFDPDAAKRVLETAQDSGIPIQFVSRHAASAVRLPKDLFDTLADGTNNPVARYLKQGVAGGLQHLWERVNMPQTDPRRKLPPRCNPAWFSANFCKNAEIPIDASGDIWPYVAEVTPYDVLALFAVFPTLRDRFFTPYHVTRHGTTHTIIGVNELMPNVNNPAELQAFLTDCLTKGIQTLTELTQEKYTETDLEQALDLGTAAVRTFGNSLSTQTLRVASLGYDAVPTSVYVQRGFTSDGDPTYSIAPVAYSIDGDLVVAGGVPVYD